MEHSKLVGAVSNCAVSTYHGIYAVRLETLVTIDRTAPTGGRKCPFIFRIHHNRSHATETDITTFDMNWTTATTGHAAAKDAPVLF